MSTTGPTVLKCQKQLSVIYRKLLLPPNHKLHIYQGHKLWMTSNPHMKNLTQFFSIKYIKIFISRCEKCKNKNFNYKDITNHQQKIISAIQKWTTQMQKICCVSPLHSSLFLLLWLWEIFLFIKKRWCAQPNHKLVSKMFSKNDQLSLLCNTIHGIKFPVPWPAT